MDSDKLFDLLIDVTDTINRLEEKADELKSGEIRKAIDSATDGLVALETTLRIALREDK